MTTMVTKGAMNITLSKRSRMPPWPQQEKIKTATLIIKIIRKQRYKQDACRILLLQ